MQEESQFRTAIYGRMANLQYSNGEKGLPSEDLEFIEEWFQSELFKNLVSA